VVPAVHIPSKVAQPHVVAGVGEEEAKCLGTVADDVVGGGAEQAVLEEDDGAGAGDAVEGEQVAVLREGGVRLAREPRLRDQLKLWRAG
jgi:hypothetical protein